MKRKKMLDVELLRKRVKGLSREVGEMAKGSEQTRTVVVRGEKVEKKRSLREKKRREARKGEGSLESVAETRSEEVRERGLGRVKRRRAVEKSEARDGQEKEKVRGLQGKRKRRYGSIEGERDRGSVGVASEEREEEEELLSKSREEAVQDSGAAKQQDSRVEARGGKERKARRLVEGRKEYSPVRRIPSKAGRTNDFGLKYNRWYEVRKKGGWVGKYGKVAGGGKRGRKTEKERLGEYEKKRSREEVERARKRNTGRKGKERGSDSGEREVREMGPRRRSGVRRWGKERRENGRPGEKRVRRSRSETRSVRGREVRKKGKGKKEGEERWNRVKRREGDVKKYSQSYVRETREARKRYVERRGKKEKSRRRKNQKGRHERRMEREDPERVGGKGLMEKVREKSGVRRTGRGEGVGVKSEGTGRKARREVQKREEYGERRNWGRKGLGRDGRVEGKRLGLQRRGVWRTKEKRAVERSRYGSGEGEGKKARRRDEVGRRERREKKEWRKRGGKEREGYMKRKGREAKYMRRQGEE